MNCKIYCKTEGRYDTNLVSWLVASQVVITTVSDDKFGIIATLGFQWYKHVFLHEIHWSIFIGLIYPLEILYSGSESTIEHKGNLTIKPQQNATKRNPCA